MEDRVPRTKDSISAARARDQDYIECERIADLYKQSQAIPTPTVPQQVALKF
jgi:hypothetical protein